MVELSYDEKHLISLVVPHTHTDRHTDRQTDTQTDLGVELTSPFGRGQLKREKIFVRVSMGRKLGVRVSELMDYPRLSNKSNMFKQGYFIHE